MSKIYLSFGSLDVSIKWKSEKLPSQKLLHFSNAAVSGDYSVLFHIYYGISSLANAFAASNIESKSGSSNQYQSVRSF